MQKNITTTQQRTESRERVNQFVVATGGARGAEFAQQLRGLSGKIAQRQGTVAIRTRTR
jgi:NADH dehydrogenase FAD-containing subunit